MMTLSCMLIIFVLLWLKMYMSQIQTALLIGDLNLFIMAIVLWKYLV